MPVCNTHSTAGVPINRSLSSTAVCVTEEAADWGFTGCCGTERRLWHPRAGPERKQSILNKLNYTWQEFQFHFSFHFVPIIEL